MPNVKVDLYNSSNSYLASTKTDANGSYVFDNLNPLDRYYVKFTYNGQYYEPTWYTAPSNLGDNYQDTSNGTDFILERTSFNVKFKEIGSSPNNYGTNKKTYTALELLGVELDEKGKQIQTGTPVVDQYIVNGEYFTYGNLIMESSTNPDLQAKINFVKDCQMSSYTKSGKGSYDLYPFSKVVEIACYIYNDGSVGRDIKIPLLETDSWGNLNYIAYHEDGSKLDKSMFINQGLKLRQKTDMLLKKDVNKITLTINGKKEEYIYNNRGNEPIEVSARLSDLYYDEVYSREIYPSDYQFKISDYGKSEIAALYGKTKADELEIYIQYKIIIVNQSQSIRTRITEVVDYYDQDLTFIKALNGETVSYMQVLRGIDYSEKYDVRESTTSMYGKSTMSNIDGYDRLYFTGVGLDSKDNEIYLDSGNMIELYLTFQVEKNTVDGEDWLKIDQDLKTGDIIGVGKENIAEINGYKTLYKTGTVIPNVTDDWNSEDKYTGTGNNVIAGLIDEDSNPGNLNPADVLKDGEKKITHLEDDTDIAPPVTIVLTNDPSGRIISGYVWEDEKTKTLGITTTGDGVRQDSETKINGVNVELVEVMENGQEYIWRKYNINGGTGSLTEVTPIINVNNVVKNYKFTGDTTGTYAFCSFIPGNYIVRFSYGDTKQTVLTNLDSAVNKVLGEKGNNAKSYNGQDYQSTIYQEGLSTYSGNNTSKGYTYDITKGDMALVSDVKDLWVDRQRIVNYSYNGDSLSREKKNAFAELLASPNSLPVYNGKSYTKDQMLSMINELIANTHVTAETGVINIQLEYNREVDNNNSLNNSREYHLKNLDLGLQERPKAQIAVDKEITSARITLANGTILVDATKGAGKIDNVVWNYHVPYLSGYKYGTGLMDPEKYGSIENIRKVNANKYGLFNITVDEELMHGATVTINYRITVTNVGEVDYKDDESFFYTGIVTKQNNVVTTTAHEIIDYVPNNMKFYVADNPNWKVVTADTLLSQGLVNEKLTENIKQYNSIITSTSIDTALVPTIYKENLAPSMKDSVEIPLVLTQLITAENETDDLTYTNIVEVVRTTNTNGRRNNYSVVGNQDPLQKPQELDSDMVELILLPPYGNAGLPYIIATVIITAIGIAIAGVIFVKKKAIK